ncbi:MAG: hypothetical protein ACTHKG_21635 [Nocardioides sp.]
MDEETTQKCSNLDDLQDWAKRHDRPVNLTVIETILAAGGTDDGPRPLWRAGDVAAAVERAVDVAPVAFLVDAKVLEDSRDGWFRFLRNTGKLGTGSADVGVLRREARRAARAARDTAMTLVAELFASGDEPEEPWDDPDDPRHENVRALRDLGIDNIDVVARSWGRLPDPGRAADLGWASKYVIRLRQLAQGVGSFIELDGLLFPSVAVAQELISCCPPGTFDGAVCRPNARTGELSLSHEFISLWFDVHTAGLVALKDRRAVPGPALSRQQRQSALQRLQPVVRVGRARFDDLATDREFGAGLIYLVVKSLWSGCDWVSLADLPERTPWPWFLRSCDIESSRALDEVRTSVHALAEAGVLDYDLDGDQARLTAFGVWVVDSWLCEQFDPTSW